MSGERCVLVVDDELGMRETLVEILSQSGYRVRSAVDGDDALAANSDRLRPRLRRIRREDLPVDQDGVGCRRAGAGDKNDEARAAGDAANHLYPCLAP